MIVKIKQKQEKAIETTKDNSRQKQKQPVLYNNNNKKLIHAMHSIFAANEAEAILLVDVENIFIQYIEKYFYITSNIYVQIFQHTSAKRCSSLMEDN